MFERYYARKDDVMTVFDMFVEAPFEYLTISRGEVYGNRIIGQKTLRGIVKIKEGMIFTIEPMLTLGTIEWDLWDDNWTVVTRDRKRTAQFEHTMVVTSDGVDVLTLP